MLFAISRRQALIGSACVLHAILAAPVRAFEPITVGAILSAIASAASAISGARTEKDVRDRLRLINSKLDLVIANQRYMIAKIEELKLYIDEALWNHFRTNAEFDLAALHDRYRFLVSGDLSRRTRPQFEDLATDIENITNKLGRYDFSAYSTYMTGVTVSLTLRQLLTISADQLNTLKTLYREKLDDWLDINNPLSVAKAINLQKNKITEMKNGIDNFPREINEIFWEGPNDSGGNSVCQYRRYLSISGDMTNGFSGELKVDKMECWTPRAGCKEECPAYDYNPHTFAVEDEPDYSGIPDKKNLDSPYVSVNEINLLRNMWIDASRHERNLIFISRNIKKSSDLLIV